MKISALIFDLDGVLVFTDKFHYLAWKSVADELGVPFDEKENDRLRGVSRTDSLEILLERYRGAPLTLREKEEIADRKNRIYRSYLATMTEKDVVGEVRRTLAALKRRGYLLAVGSSSKNAAYILEKTGLIRAFDGVSDGNGIKRSKPDPEVFLNAAALLGVAPASCAVIEDAFVGVDAAKAGGMLAVGIGAAAGYEKTDVRLTRFSDLLSYF